MHTIRVTHYFSIPLAILLVFVVVIFPALETSMVSAATTTTVNVSQQITAEVSITVASTSLILLPSIQGLTGGTGTSSTTINVITNNALGYNILLQASTTANATSAMQGITPSLGPGYIKDYAASAPETWFDTSSGQASQFGFGITNVSLSAANAAAGYTTCTTDIDCFSKSPTTTAKQIVYVNKPTSAAGDTIRLKFRVHLPANSNPLVPQDWYSATTTLTAVLN